MRKATLLYPKLSYLIVGLCFEAHNHLGRYSREKQYGDYLEKLFKSRNIDYEREMIVKGAGNVLDFVINKQIALELKTKEMITKNDYYQVQRYLQSSALKYIGHFNMINAELNCIKTGAMKPTNKNTASIGTTIAFITGAIIETIPK